MCAKGSTYLNTRLYAVARVLGRPLTESARWAGSRATSRQGLCHAARMLEKRPEYPALYEAAEERVIRLRLLQELGIGNRVSAR